jgi:mono/diheme cytochrome c family protein
MAQLRRLLPLLLCVALPTACADDEAGPAATIPTPDTGTPTDCPGTECRPPDDTCPDGPPCRLRADWSREATLTPGENRRDIYRVGPDALQRLATAGIGHALVWPIDVSGVLLPWPPMATLLDPDTDNPTTRSLQDLARRGLGFGTTPEMYDWLGLAAHDGAPLAFGNTPWPDWVQPGDRLGAGVIDTAWGEALTFSCATCHVAQVFGRTVVGMTNRSAQANEFFHAATTFFPALTPEFFQETTGATDLETELLVRTQQRLGAVGMVLPQARGLDTSLAQVSLSLARRNQDPDATFNLDLQDEPRPNALATTVADSKPAVWWTMKHKTRWLSDGSIVSGNPVFTNFLWNELGRGTDLVELRAWLDANPLVIEELTALVFATEPPTWSSFFGDDSLDEPAALRGEALFTAHCASCHGTYEKGWSLPGADALSPAERLATTRVVYHAQTPVMDVGTDLLRAQGMAAFAEGLNELAISQWMETVVEVQTGYVPPPLDGIFLRYPYLHNQSVPTLCDLLVPASQRTPVFWMGPSDNPDTDFDARCVGFPVGDAIPETWRATPRAEFDTARAGMSNQGHDAWLTAADGSPLLSEVERMDLIEFLKTL